MVATMEGMEAMETMRLDQLKKYMLEVAAAEEELHSTLSACRTAATSVINDVDSKADLQVRRVYIQYYTVFSEVR
jgi:hypothetical protein